jgi:anti-sigma B factor antagonist
VVRQVRDVLVLELTGKILGGPESEGIRRELDRILQLGAIKLLVNLSGVPWMNSAGLGILLSGYSRLRDRGGRMGFCGVQERVREILETTKLVTVLEIFADEQSGISALGSEERPAQPIPAGS